MDREAVGTGGALPSYIHESHVNGVTFFFPFVSSSTRGEGVFVTYR